MERESPPKIDVDWKIGRLPPASQSSLNDAQVLSSKAGAVHVSVGFRSAARAGIIGVRCPEDFGRNTLWLAAGRCRCVADCPASASASHRHLERSECAPLPRRHVISASFVQRQVGAACHHSSAYRTVAHGTDCVRRTPRYDRGIPGGSSPQSPSSSTPRPRWGGSRSMSCRRLPSSSARSPPSESGTRSLPPSARVLGSVVPCPSATP